MRWSTRQYKKVLKFVRGESGELAPRLREGMVRLHEALRETPFGDKYWINGGLLLGCIRDGQPLPNDPDVDFSYWKHDVGLLLDAVPKLKSSGFRPKFRYINNDGDVTQLSFMYRGVKYEFFEMHESENQMRWYCYGGKPKLELLNAGPMHGLSDYELFGKRWQIPDDPAAYLSALYGDWRTPDPDYNYVTDSNAVIRRREWEGTSKW